jgi:hypothetical protein
VTVGMFLMLIQPTLASLKIRRDIRRPRFSFFR